MTDERTEWLAWRSTGIGASDIAGILGISPWQSPWSIWADKVGLLPRDDAASDAMRFGLVAERAILQWFSDHTGLHWNQFQQHMAGPEPWMLATVDALAWEPGPETPDSEPIAVVEVKTTADHPDRWAEQIPDHYQAQACWQHIVTGLPVIFAVLHVPFGRVSLGTYDYLPAADDIAYVLAKARWMWDLVQAGVPPEPDAHDATTEAIKSAFAHSAGTVAYADDETRTVVEALRAAKQAAKSADAVVTELENRVKAAMAEADELRYGDTVLATWKEQERSGLDIKALRARLPRTAARFESTSTSRVLRLKKGEPT